MAVSVVTDRQTHTHTHRTTTVTLVHAPRVNYEANVDNLPGRSFTYIRDTDTSNIGPSPFCEGTVIERDTIISRCKYLVIILPYPRERGPMGGAPYIAPKLGDGPIFKVSVSRLYSKERPGKLPR